MSEKDEQLIYDYLKGDEKSLEILIIKYLKSVYGLIFKYVKNEADASDITQDVFVKMWKNLKKYKKGGNFNSWLLTIAKNTALDFLKKKKTIPFSNFSDENENNVLEESLASDNILPDEELEKLEMNKRLAVASGKLSEKYRQVLDLHNKKEMSFQEIADLLGESINTIKSRYKRALEQIRGDMKNSI